MQKCAIQYALTANRHAALIKAAQAWEGSKQQISPHVDVMLLWTILNGLGLGLAFPANQIKTMVVVDFGVKKNILRNLAKLARATVVRRHPLDMKH